MTARHGIRFETTASGIPTLEEHYAFRGEMERAPRVILPFHKQMFHHITAWSLGELPDGKRHLAICIPPGHGKTCMAHDAITWLTGLVPDSQWIYAGYSASLAVTQTMRIRDVMRSDWYREVYPAATIKDGQGARHHFETVSGGSVYGTGLEGSVTGFRAGRKRAHFGGGIVIDDPLKPLEARSEAMRENVNRWFTETLLSRRNHDATPILIIMQRLHENDLVGHVLKTMPGEWHALTIPALDEATGDMLWPETFSRETAEMLREVDPGAFYAQYQQSPVMPGGNIIKLSWWRTFAPWLGQTGQTGQTGIAGSDGSDRSTGTAGSTGSTGTAGSTGSAGSAGQAGIAGATGTDGSTGSAGTAGSTGSAGSNGPGGAGRSGTGAPGTGLIFLTADTAYKARDDADASVIRAWLATRENLYCLDAVYGRWEFPRLLEEARNFWEKWRERGAREFWVEDKASGTPLAQTLRGNGVPAEDWRPADFDFPDDKVGRMSEAAWSVHGGRVLLPEGTAELHAGNGTVLRLEPHAKVLAEECAAFARDLSHSHDDHCDTLTMAVSLWRFYGGGK